MLNSGYLANVSTYCLVKPICRAGEPPAVLCVTRISPWRAEKCNGQFKLIRPRERHLCNLALHAAHTKEPVRAA